MKINLVTPKYEKTEKKNNWHHHSILCLLIPHSNTFDLYNLFNASLLISFEEKIKMI